MFGFDEQYPMFDVTPVDNQFILEYMPQATENAVRVYLYGLMQCYHPQTAMTVEQMARDLGMTEEAVLTAYRHWERKGLVKRVADHPPTYRYVSVKQAVFMGSAAPQDPEYDAFASALYEVFGNSRRLHGKEISQCYEWVEDLHLPVEVVIAMVRHAVRQHGKGVSIKSMEKLATLLAEEKVATPEDAQQVLERDSLVFDGSRAVIRRMGKRRNPSDDEMALYRKWIVNWGFTAEDVLAACAELTKGDPNFKYLDGVLARLHQQRTDTGVKRGVEETLTRERDASAPLKALLNVMNMRGVSINEGTLKVYEDMRALYPDGIILMAGRECAAHGLTFDGVLQTLQIWKREGLKTAEDITAYMKDINDQNDSLKLLYEVLGMEGTRPNAADRRLLRRWQQEFGFDAAFIVRCAPWAVGKDRPMAYLGKLLEVFSKKGVADFDAAQKERDAFQTARPAAAVPVRGPKVVGEQQYTQREYVHTEDALDEMMKKWQEENGNA